MLSVAGTNRQLVFPRNSQLYALRISPLWQPHLLTLDKAASLAGEMVAASSSHSKMDDRASSHADFTAVPQKTSL